jgi:hypothetical protein
MLRPVHFLLVNSSSLRMGSQAGMIFVVFIKPTPPNEPTWLLLRALRPTSKLALIGEKAAGVYAM